MVRQASFAQYRARYTPQPSVTYKPTSHTSLHRIALPVKYTLLRFIVRFDRQLELRGVVHTGLGQRALAGRKNSGLNECELPFYRGTTKKWSNKGIVCSIGGCGSSGNTQPTHGYMHRRCDERSASYTCEDMSHTHVSRFDNASCKAVQSWTREYIFSFITTSPFPRSARTHSGNDYCTPDLNVGRRSGS